jgi:lysophospholipase L1-like esterase
VQPPLLDVLCDGTHAMTLELPENGSAARIAGLPAGVKELELWLPHLYQFQLRGLRLAPGSRAEPARPSSRPRWIHYGSSICQGVGAASPSTTWPAVVAREAGLDLMLLAFGAACNLQPMFACLIRSLPADLITCMVGHNDLAFGGLHNFPANLVGFIKVIREGHPRTPIVVMSPIMLPYWEQPPTPGSESMPAYREQARHVVELLREHGDAALHYVDGLDLLGEHRGDLYLEPSLWAVHPSSEGHQILAANVRKALASIEECPAEVR